MTICIVVFSIAIAALFPRHSQSCGGEYTPVDYFTSFFQRGLESDRTTGPFSYTFYSFLYNENETVPVEWATSLDWAKRFQVADSAAYAAIIPTDISSIKKLEYAIRTKNVKEIDDSLRPNAFIQAVFSAHDSKTAAYLSFAKTVEPLLVTPGWDAYEKTFLSSADEQKKYSIAAEKAANASKDLFLRNRYAYQALRLSYYLTDYKRAAALYKKFFSGNTDTSTISVLALGIRAGISYRYYNNIPEACYLYSQAFAKGLAKRVSNYVSFSWAYNPDIAESEYFALCKNSLEAADLAAMIALHTPAINVEGIKKVTSLNPRCQLLQTLAVREVQKIEERLLSSYGIGPTSQAPYRLAYHPPPVDSSKEDVTRQAKELVSLLHSIAHTTGTSNPSLFEIAAAHLSYVLRDNTTATTYLESSKNMVKSPALTDQWELTKLLVTISDKPIIDASFEASLLPSLQWAEKKSKTSEEWREFHRALYSSVLAPKYLFQNDLPKMIFCIGRAGLIWSWSHDSLEYYYSYGEALNWTRDVLSLDEQKAVYAFVSKTEHTPFEKLLLEKNVLMLNDVTDAVATAYIRRNDWQNAAEWLAKVPDSYYDREVYKTYLAANPFSTVLNDTHAPTEQDTIRYTKKTFVKKMSTLQETINSSASKEVRAVASFNYGLGLYAMSFWGNSWMLTEYSWSGTHLPDSLSSDFQREYFGVYTAEKYFKQAFELASSTTFKAKCLFFAARCNQKNIEVPSSEPGNRENLDIYGVDTARQNEYLRRFIFNERYFPTLVKNYSTTTFFEEAVATCSYLKDFVNR